MTFVMHIRFEAFENTYRRTRLKAIYYRDSDEPEFRSTYKDAYCKSLCFANLLKKRGVRPAIPSG
jgi:acyl-coenzyme A synthetase/AMP-(fatty) acid ligase